VSAAQHQAALVKRVTDPIVIRIAYGEANYQMDTYVSGSRETREDKRLKPILPVEVWKRAAHGLAAQRKDQRLSWKVGTRWSESALVGGKRLRLDLLIISSPN